VRAPVVAAETLRTKFKSGEKTGILFGRERWGLTNEEVALADEIVTFPVNPAFASLNIAQAVLLMSYEWMKSGMEDLSETLFEPLEQQQATKEQLYGLFEQLEEALDARGYFRPEGKKQRMIENLRAVLSRRALTSQEISVLRGVFGTFDKYGRQTPRGSNGPYAEGSTKEDDGNDA
jgi:tRNA/rRNA methyltransferase